MAIQTFTSGQILTAADTNTYLANSGLVYVTSFTVGTGVTTAVCASAFNSTYDNYRIVMGGGVGSADSSLTLQLGASVAGYNGIVSFSSFAAPTVPASAGSSTAVFSFVGYIGANFMQASFDLISPNKATFTSLNNASWTAPTVAGTSNGIHSVATAYTGFTIATNGVATMTGGTITVYGYRKA
jgi:hypothetical protein